MAMSNPAWTVSDIPDQTDRIAVITGANSGLGLETARALAASGATVVMAVRNTEKGRSAIDEIRANGTNGDPDADIELLELDLASLDSIRTAATELHDRFERIDLLINNAGVMYTPKQETADGFEMQFGTNHLGHFAWTGLVIDRLLPVEGSRVVTVSSVGHRIRSRIDFDDLQAEEGYNRVSAYGRSKLANLLFTYELQRRLAAADTPTVALAAHPGGSDTELGRHIPGARWLAPLLRPVTQSAAKGALPTLRAATDPDAEGGQYYGPDGFMETRGDPVVVTSNERSHDVDTQRRLWAASEDLTGVTFPI
ncbi:SDR family NAD(P)-dependent oxidoreductase [Ilumatobacter sp.]|uniref:SDR family NAD(P)-dependent oxidoreductase n=1 Tax=Ilumatobacter sp. TaxID=1967498 RepID=UPI003AF6BD33